MTLTCPRCGLTATDGELALCPRCLLSDDPAEAPPLALPGLTLARKIGHGGMGAVYLARHERLGREVAVKVLASELADSADFRLRFEREARALARLSHPHIVTIHDFGQTPDGSSYLVMENVAGGTLTERIPLAPERALEVMLEVCAALEAAHASGIVHRDLKPDNVLFDERERVKLADFGIARLLDPEARDAVTHPALVAGTPVYMAPEAHAGAAPDARMDVYAAGVVLREMLTGRPHPDALVPAPFREVVLRACAADPERRLQSATELANWLRSLDRATRGSAELLPAEEQSWQRAVALAFSAATAVALYAMVTSLTPRMLGAGEPLPLLVLGTKQLPDGRVFVLSHFQTWPTLAGAASFSVALASYGMLRRHWRTAGFDRPAPARPLPTANAVLWLGLALFASFGLHTLLRGVVPAVAAVAPYLPVFGGMFEFVLLYLVWLSVLEALRTERPLRREPKLWVGLALGLVPPATEFVSSLASF